MAINRFLKQEKIVNQPITIQDLMVYHEKFDENTILGEAVIPLTKVQQDNFLDRLINHIDNLANIANQFHQNKYCEFTKNTYQLKKEHLNTITRLCFSEFSLYTHQPLNLSQLQKLITAIEKIASKQQDNLHLLLATFSFVDKENNLFNLCLYIECGERPKIHSVCKSSISPADYTYKKSKTASDASIYDSTKNKLFNLFNFHPYAYDKNIPSLTSFYFSQGKELISNKSNFIITTQGGAQAILAIEICLEHTYEKAKNQFGNMPFLFSSSPLPRNANHIVTSCTISTIQQHLICPSLTHIDPASNFTQYETSPTISCPEFGSNLIIIEDSEKTTALLDGRGNNSPLETIENYNLNIRNSFFA